MKRLAAMPWIALALMRAASVQEDYHAASALFQQQRLSEAGDALDRALRADPEFVPAWILRGRLAMAVDRFDVARPAFERAVELAPDSAQARFMLGFLLYVANDFAQARSVLAKAAALDPSDPDAVFYLAMAEEALARPAEALRHYEKALALQDRAGSPNADTHTAYARLLFTLGRHDESARQITRVLQIDPASRDGHYEQGRLYFEAGKFAEAVVEGEKALQAKGLGTTDRQIHFLLVRAYTKLPDAARAEQHRKLFEASAPTLRR
jgi:tetratricopeptide (TPR) repeat protein